MLGLVKENVLDPTKVDWSDRPVYTMVLILALVSFCLRKHRSRSQIAVLIPIELDHTRT